MTLFVKASFHLVVTVVAKSFSTMLYSLDPSFLLWSVVILVIESVDRRPYSITSVT